MNHTPIPSEELELFKKLPRIKTIVDVGARADTDYLRLKSRLTLHAFEPNKQFFDELCEAVAAIPENDNTIYLNNYGLGDTNGFISYNNAYQAFIEGEAPVEIGHQLFEVSLLDSYVEEMGIKRIDFLKIDAEGYDFKVLLGAPKAIEMTRFIQYEHWDNTEEYHELLGDRFDMEYVGYRNVLCMNKKLVSQGTRDKLKKFILDKKYKDLT